MHQGHGCIDCSGTGYRGREAITELLDMSDRIRELILARRPASEIRALLGAPHEIHRVPFGANTDREWDGIVFVYHARKDELFEHSVVYRSSEFAFALVEGDTLLNHWSIESQGPAGDEE